MDISLSLHTGDGQPGDATHPHTADIRTPRGRAEAARAHMQAGGNPFLLLAGPLLRALADFGAPQASPPGPIAELHDLLHQEVQLFTQLCDQLNLRRDHMLAARYALCTALDENIQRQPWAKGEAGQAGPWSQHLLLNDFHQSRDGGRTVFLLIGRMADQAQEHLHVLELMLHILALGFKGHYGGAPDGERQLDAIRHRLHALLAPQREAPAAALSPHWQGVGRQSLGLLRAVPVWVSASLAGLLLFALFGWLKYQLLTDTRALEQRIDDLRKLHPPAASTPAPVPAAKAAAKRLQDWLAADIAAGLVEVQESAKESRVTLKGDQMFVPAQAQVADKARRILARVAAGLNQFPGQVHITGHSDNQRIRSREFADNQALSEARAQAVAEVLGGHGVTRARLHTAGRGDSEPVADNDTAAGRARNRRVDIVLSYSQ